MRLSALENESREVWNPARAGSSSPSGPQANAGTSDAYLEGFGLYRPIMPSEPWHVEATKP